jgi:hypothetical protein
MYIFLNIETLSLKNVVVQKRCRQIYADPRLIACLTGDISLVDYAV